MRGDDVTKSFAETEPHEPSRSGCFGCLLGGGLWLWLVLVGFVSFISGIAVGGCSGRACEVRVTRIWTALIIAQGVVFVAGIVLTRKGRLNALVWLAVVSPALFIIAMILYEVVI